MNKQELRGGRYSFLEKFGMKKQIKKNFFFKEEWNWNDKQVKFMSGLRNYSMLTVENEEIMERITSYRINEN